MAPRRLSNEDIDMDLFADENARFSEPPPRLAARFYRKSNSRRRSSAHSSRCSSLSSRHSRTSRNSALSCHGGPHSTHIAQHLRRASIIESRKARLADRAAHAEQVRLRAAAAKAAPRVSNSEGKAQAAQAAREKLLAEITARCEEEVRRAKRVAEETREKKAAEDARRRDEMEEKFAQAARRRSMYQSASRRSRTTSLAAVEEKKINPTTLRQYGQTGAAKVIQRAWRSWRRGKAVRNFLGLELVISRLCTLSFEDVTRILSEEDTIILSKTLLKQLNLLDSGSDEIAERGAVRVFLSAYVIVSHPVQTFSHAGNNALEQELISKGKALLNSFEERVRAEASQTPRPTVLRKDKEQLQYLFNTFNAAFHAWKSRDLNVLLDVMVGSFVNLDLIIQTTKDDVDGNVAEDYLQAVRQEQIKLLAKLKRLAGPEEALSRVRTAVRKARREKASKTKLTTVEHVPRATVDKDIVIDAAIEEPLTPPATPRQPSNRTDPHAASLVTRLGQTMTVLPTNREIAHEMQINGTYEIQQQPWTDSRKTLADSLRQSMRDSMQSNGSRAASSWTHAMTVLIRDKLLNLVSQRHPLYDRIDGFLDPKLIEQECRNNVFSYESFFENIGKLIGQICSPGRDEAIKAFISDTSSDTIDRLFSLINIIDLMTLDHINFQFRMAARSVIEHGHEHEYGLFERNLQDRKHSLNCTTRWWNTAKANLPANSPSNAAYGSAIYVRGLVDLVLSNSSLQHNDLPETLRLDWIRLLNLRAKLFQMTAVSSILLTTKIRLRRNREALWSKDAEKLMNLDLPSVDANRIVSVIESSHMMPESTREGLLNFVNRVLPSAVAAIKKARDAEQDRLLAIQERRMWNVVADTNPTPSTEATTHDVFNEQIATFLLKTVREHVFARVAAASTADRVRLTTSTPEILARAGMPEFVADVSTLVNTLERIKIVDLKAHGKWYDEVATASSTGNNVS